MNFITGINLYKKAKSMIPGGTQLLSKRPEMFLPDQWPSYFKKVKGVDVWDLDGNKLIDMSYMGIGACTLGYADDDVNNAVKQAVDDGSMCTLNCPEEVELAELMFKLHPWAGGIRYARCGGEAMSIAIRIARAKSKKDKVAFSGYHGWHDWYLSCNLADDHNLDGQLLKGLDPNGVPRGLTNTSIPFEYNNIAKLEQIVKDHDIGTIVIETFRHEEEKDNFVKKVREIADRIGAILICDEVSIAWRMCVGGVHLLQKVTPDIAVFAKAMSNGYPMGAIIGKREIMEAAQTSFISSTYWTERVGPTASLATIKKMQKVNLPKHLDKIGGMICEGWLKIGKENGLNIKTLPPNALATFTWPTDYPKPLELKTLFTQEMLKRGYLATPSVYVSYCHTPEVVKKYLENVNEVFGIIKKGIDNKNIPKLLEGPVCHGGFQRLTN